MAVGNRDELDRILAELVDGPDACEGRYTGNTMSGCGRPATEIVYIDGGRGDGLGSFCPACGGTSYAAKAVFAHWDGSSWVKARDLPPWATPQPATAPPSPNPYPFRRRR